jgi:hypothetical protein
MGFPPAEKGSIMERVVETAELSLCITLGMITFFSILYSLVTL